MSGTAQSSDASFQRVAAERAPPAARAPAAPAPWTRDGLMHPTALPLGFALGCCLGLVTAAIVLF